MTGKHVPTFDPAITGGIVVGHDGSGEADRALRWAVEEGALRGWPLHVVRAWVLSTAIRETGVPFGVVPSMDQCQQAVADHLAESASGVGTDSVPVYRHAVHGASAQVLMAAAASPGCGWGPWPSRSCATPRARWSSSADAGGVRRGRTR